MSLPRSNFRFSHRLRVRWAEVDMQKIVFNAHYLMYFDTAMGDYWRALALPYEAAMEQLGGDFYVKKSSVEYHASARYDDQLEVCLRCARIGTSSMVFEGAIFCASALLVTCELIYVFANPATQVSQPVPAVLRGILEGYEQGAPLVDLQVGDWQALGVSSTALRTEVFVQEQGMDPQLVWDAGDAVAVHALARNQLGQPIAVGRLLQAAPGIGRIGRMAVNRVLRGGRLGSGVLQALVEAARERGDQVVVVHAQHSAVGFYSRHGFVPRGDAFVETGIPHQEMVLAL
ncbi:MAG: YbgC/FadM family acyl-CoA thioesterase [Rhodoferax sp.]